MPVILPPGVVLRPAATAQNLVQPTADNVTPLTVRGFSATQSADLLDVSDGSNNNALSVTAARVVTVAGAYPNFGRLIVNGFRQSSSSLPLLQLSDVGFGADAGINVLAGTPSSIYFSDGQFDTMTPCNISAGGILNPIDGTKFSFGNNIMTLNTANIQFTPGRLGVGLNLVGTSGAQVVIKPAADATQALALQGNSATQTGPLLELVQISSTAVARDVGLIDGAFAVSTDATRQGRLLLKAAGFNGGASEGLRVEGDGTAGGTKIGFLGGSAVAKQAGASAAGIAAITDASAKAAISALQNALAAYNLVTAPA